MQLTAADNQILAGRAVLASVDPRAAAAYYVRAGWRNITAQAAAAGGLARRETAVGLAISIGLVKDVK